MRLLDQGLGGGLVDARQRHLHLDARPNPPSERGPMPTVVVTLVSAGTLAGPPWEATNFMAPMKQAE